MNQFHLFFWNQSNKYDTWTHALSNINFDDEFLNLPLYILGVLYIAYISNFFGNCDPGTNQFDAQFLEEGAIHLEAHLKRHPHNPSKERE